MLFSFDGFFFQTETFVDKIQLGVNPLILRREILFILRSSIAKIDGVNSEIAKIVV